MPPGRGGKSLVTNSVGRTWSTLPKTDPGPLPPGEGSRIIEPPNEGHAGPGAADSGERPLPSGRRPVGGHPHTLRLQRVLAVPTTPAPPLPRASAANQPTAHTLCVLRACLRTTR